LTSAAPVLVAVGSVLLGAAFLLPGHYLPWLSFQQEVTAALGAALIAGSAWSTAARLRCPPPATVFLLVAFIPLVQYLASLVWHLSDAVLPCLYLLACACCVVAGCSLTQTDRRRLIDTLFGVLLLAAVTSALLALLQWLRFSTSLWIADLRPGGRPYANLAQPNHLASLLALGVIATLHRYERRGWSGTTALVLLALLGVAMVSTQSRTGALFVFLLAGWALARHRSVGLRTSPAAVVACALVFLAAALTWGSLNDALLLSGAPSLGERLAPGRRVVHWQTLAAALEHSPWVGFGWNQVSVAQQLMAPAYESTHEQLAHSHNLALDLMIYNGLPIGVVLVGLLLVWFCRQVRMTDELDRFAVLAAIGALLLHALLEFPLHYAYFLLPCALMVGALEAIPASTTKSGPTVSRRVLACTVALLVGALGWVATEYSRVETAATAQRFDQLGIGPAIDIAPPNVLLLDQPREFHRFVTSRARPGMSEQDIEWMRRVALRSPSPPALLRYALALGLNGRHREANRVLSQLCKTASPDRCLEGNASWRALQAEYPALTAVPYPQL
jgi:O-antigen ligase